MKKRKKSSEQKYIKYLKKKFDLLKREGVEIFLFADPDNRAFLRMHKPDKYGDDLKNIRYSVEYVNKTKKAVFGFEQGKISHAFRHVYPIYNEYGRYLGCIDVSFSSEFMQRTIDNINKMHSHFIVNKSILDKRIWESREINSFYKPSIEHENYMISEIKEVNHIRKNISKQIIEDNKDYIEMKINSLEEFAIYGSIKEESIVISFVPIANIKDRNKASAYIVSYTTNSEINNTLNSFYVINLISFVLILIVLYLIYKQIIHKKELSLEVYAKTKELKKLNEELEERILIESERNRKKDKQLYEQSKNAQMGEMIGNIAHQWRQPLSIISIVASGLKLKLEYGIFEHDDAVKDLDKLNNTAQHLSKTIDIFRDFIKDNKDLKELIIQERINYSLTIVETSLLNNHIKLINNVDYSNPLKIELIEGELSQVLINIINNSIDALKNTKDDNRWIKINLEVNEKIVNIIIEDNAGGIPKDIISKVFDPYFTTKHQSQGTGIGLYMSAQIVEKHMNGKLYVKNTNNGAKFLFRYQINIIFSFYR